MLEVLVIHIPANASQATQIVPLPVHAQNLDVASRHIPSGVYTTFRTYKKFFVLHLHDHFERLEESAKLTGHLITINSVRIRMELNKALMKYPSDEVRVRISVDLTANPGDVYLAIEELQLPSLEEYRLGVAAMTQVMHRENPEAKVTSFISEATQARRLSTGEKINEILMISDEGTVLEGLSSNFFGVQGDVVFTAGDGILPGITRKMVIEVAENTEIPVVYKNIKLTDINKLDEAFITGASRAILPVTQINNQPVGSGQVGTVTRRLQIAFQKNLDAAVEKI